MSAQSQPRLTPEQYLEIERAALDVHSEYYNGRMCRQPSGDWLLSESARMNTVGRFDSVGCTVALNDVYAKVAFGGEAAIADRPSPEV